MPRNGKLSLRLAWVAIAWFACGKQADQRRVEPQPVAVARADAGPIASAPKGPIDLTRAVPVTIRVSSRVRNAKILPKHIADHDLETAWNSATGELVGAWVEVEANASIEQIRMSAGFTGHGPKGEDYFTMNPRIREVALTADGQPAGTFKLDVARRDLQTLAVRAKQKVRVEIVDVAPGSKVTWKEASVSELEVWGMPPPGWQAPAQPLVPKVVVYKPVLTSSDPCAVVAAQREEFERAHRNDRHEGPGADDHAYPPTCTPIDLPDTGGLDPVWANAAASCSASDEIYGPTSCSVVFERAGKTAWISVDAESAQATIKVLQMYQADVIPGGAPELVVRIELPSGAEALAVCRAVPLACSQLIDVAGEPRSGAWKARERFDHGEVVLEVIAGAAPAGVGGRRPLLFGK